MAEAIPILEIGVILLLAALVGFGFRRLGLPAVVGYLLVGLLVGPFTPGYVADRHQIQVLADVGVVLLLFEVGIELDLRALRREPPGILVAVPAQVAFVTIAGTIAFVALGSGVLGAVTLGLAIGLSSSIVVVNITRSRKRTADEATSRALLVWSVLQDIVTLVAATMLTVVLSPGEASAAPLAFGKAVAFVAIAAAVQDLVVPRLLRTVRGEQDTFLIVAVSAALATAGIGAAVFGVPLALGAFVSGLFLSVRAEAQEARREVLPFRDLFAVLFFVAIGTLVDPAAILREPGWLVVILALVVVKVFAVWIFAAIFRVPAHRAQLGVGLGQIGEFSFVVLGLGTAAGVVTGGQFSAALGAAALTIAGSAVGARLFPRKAPQR
ncbi:MAG TPA: cation:proton antiporter [Candidatus Limnocylindria bacterium]